MGSSQENPRAESFSAREIEILQLISRGDSNREIANKLHLSIETIKWYNKQMFMKLDVKNRVQLINEAAGLSLLQTKWIDSTNERPEAIGNLPVQLTSFVGRRNQITEIKALIRNNRLVVLTGAGGSGKTSLALKVGETLEGEFINGVWLVKLADIQDPSLVPLEILKSLGISERANSNLGEVIEQYISNKNLLLIIDNLEHLLEGASFFMKLLSAAPKLHILGTSRERLHVYGEQEYLVTPLDLPNPAHHNSRELITNIESVDLFIKRAKDADPTIFSDENFSLEDLSQICVLLDGLPLAIELSAPMVKTFSLKEIADRIEYSLDAVPKGPRNLHRRQQTIRATIQWSYNLLDPTEKRVFIRMAVFNGGVPLKVIKAICGIGISRDIGNILFTLVNKNLLQAHERQDGNIHFHLLETVRKFGLDKLIELNSYNQLADRHAEYFVDLAKQASIELRGSDQIVWISQMNALRENFRTALKWVIEKKDTESALRFAHHLFEFWLRHADFEEAHRWLEQVLDLPGASRFSIPFTNALNDLAWIKWFQSKTESSITLAEKAHSLTQAQPNNISKVVAHLNLGAMYAHQEDGLTKGKTHITEASEISHQIEAHWEHARSLMLLALIYLRAKEYDKSHSYYKNAYNLYKDLGDIYFQSLTKRLIGDLEIERGNLLNGTDAYRESLRISKEAKNPLQTAYNFLGLSNAATIEGSYKDALKYHLAGKAILENVGVWSGGYQVVWEEKLHNAHEFLDQAEVESILVSGRKMSNEKAIEYGLEVLRDDNW